MDNRIEINIVCGSNATAQKPHAPLMCRLKNEQRGDENGTAIFLLKMFGCGPFLKSFLNLLILLLLSAFDFLGRKAYGILASPPGTETAPCTERWCPNEHQACEIPVQLLWKTVWHIHFSKSYI